MRRPTIAIIVLSVALVVSNVWWAYELIDAGISATYRQVNLDRHHEALKEALAVAPVAASLSATPERVLQAARSAAGDDPSLEFEKEGFVWIGQLGYRFGEDGRLVEVQTNWSPF